MRHASLLARLLGALRSSAAILMLSSFVVSFAQAPADTKNAKLSRAAQETNEALELTKKNDLKLAPAAISKLQAAEAIYAEFGEKERLLAVLFFLGHLQLVLDQEDIGVATLSKALTVAQELEKREQQIRILGRLGEYFFKNGKTGTDNKKRALGYLEQAVAVIEQADPKPHPLSYDTYDHLGRIWMSLYNPTNANKAFLKAYHLVKNKPPEQSIPAIIKYADLQIQMGFPKYAISPLEDARLKAIAAKRPDFEALITLYIGDLMAGTFRDLPNAKRFLERADQLLAASPSEALSLKLMLSWGKYYFATFELSKAAEHLTRAVNTAGRAKHAFAGEIMLQAGIVYFTLGDLQKAIPFLEKAAEVNGASGHKLMEMHSLRYLARCLMALGRTNEAHKTMGQALGARGDSGQGYYSAESVAVLIDHSDLLIESFQKSTGPGRAPDIRLSRAKSQLDLAYRNAKRERMLESQAIAAQRLALVHSLLGDRTKSLELLNDSLITSRSAGLPVQEAGALTGFMDLSLAMGNSGAASFYGKNVVNVYQQLRKRIADLGPEQRASYLSTIEGTYRKLASLLIEQGRIAEAEQVLTMLKEEELIEYVRRDDGVAKNMLETLSLTEDERAALTRYNTIASQITSIGKELSELERASRDHPPGQFPQQKRYEDLKLQLADATLAFEKFLDQLKITFGQKDTRVVQVDSGLRKTLQRLRADRTAVVSTIVGQDTLNIIVTTSGTQRAHTIKKRADEINVLVGKLREALTSPQYDPRPASQQLYDLIVKPIEADLAGIRADTIVWSLDGTLRYIPPAVLWDKQKGYLAERFSNVMVNLASRTSLEHKPLPANQLSVLGVGVSKPVDGFSALTAVPDELDCIVSDPSAGVRSPTPQCATGMLSGRKLLDEKFTLTNFKDEMGRHPILHIASHFKLTPGDDKSSFLLLGGGDDRKFTLDKLRNESLGDVELMVLSACNTATPGGLKANGIEVESFSVLAQEEARAVIATLWPVADNSTKDFMVEFYRLYGKEGKSKADSVRLAQMRLLNGKYSDAAGQKQRGDAFVAPAGADLPKFTQDPKAPYAHPYFWSPFILIGNWR